MAHELRLRIAIADDHALFRQGLKSMLALSPDVEVVAETDKADGLRPMLDAAPCDILLLDLQMDRSSLIEIGPIAQRAKVILVTASELPDDALAAIRAGASGIVFKRFAIETLMDAIRAVAAGQVWMPPALQARIAMELREPARDPLTPREREIVRHVALGLRNAEVGKKLFISEDTVKTHLNNIFQKLGVRDRVQLTLYAIRIGLIGVHS
jgi:DNA-binding NarL/FixJ family response regulator